MFGYIPSPSSNGVSLGPLRLHMYGFLIVAGVFAAVWLADRRWRARGGAPGTFSAIAIWAVPGGLIGARIYHVITDYELYTHHPLGALEIWQGGLGIWGGIAGGTFAAWLYVRRHQLDFRAIMDTVAPALPLAQAIGRWGNYFNQELFGRPTTLPWGLKIAVGNRPAAYTNFATFHPTFLYESLWDLAVVLLVLWVEKRVRLRKGYLFAVYVALYTFGRFFTEYLRIDFAHKILGLRINDWVSVIIFLTAAGLVLVKGRAGGDVEPATERQGVEAKTPVAVVAGPSGGALVAGGDTLEEGSMGLMAEEPSAEPEPAASATVPKAELQAEREPAPPVPPLEPEPAPSVPPLEPEPAPPVPPLEPEPAPSVPPLEPEPAPPVPPLEPELASPVPPADPEPGPVPSAEPEGTENPVASTPPPAPPPA